MSSSTPVSYSHSLFKEEEVKKKKKLWVAKGSISFLLLFLFSIFFLWGCIFFLRAIKESEPFQFSIYCVYINSNHKVYSCPHSVVFVPDK